MSPILAVGLNPAWQHTLTFGSLCLGEVNRATGFHAGASGKAVNVARAAQRLGHAARILQVAGGETGRRLCRELDREGIGHVSVKVRAPTRVCTTCLDAAKGTMTELIGPAAGIPDNAVRRLREHVAREVPASGGVALCGTLPPGVPPEIYAQITVAAHRQGIPVVLDAWRDAAPALAAGPDILKVNRDELLHLMAASAIAEAATGCLSRHRVGAVAVTDGPANAWLFTRKGAWQYILPPLPGVVSPLGAGDTVTAVLLARLLGGLDLPEAFAEGLAAGSASCLTDRPAQFDPAAMTRLRRGIEMRLA
jgi:tagatose 6-phosphate kinase